MVDSEKETRRYFVSPEEDKTYFIEPPTAEDIRGADWQYSKTYTQCLVEGITTSAEMIDILTRRGIIGPEFEQRANELSEKLAIKLNALDSVEDMDAKRELAFEVARAREAVFQWNQRLNGPMNNTAEQISDDARLEYLTSSMVVDENNKRVWDSYSAYLKEKSNALALKSRFEVMLYLQGLTSDFLEQTPEALAIREVEQHLMEKAEAVITAADAVAEENKDTEETKEVESKDTTSKRKPRPRKKKD